MDKSKIFIKNAKPTKIGGQAILGGIMMRGEKKTAIVMRLPDGGMHMKTQPTVQAKSWQKIPILRGMVVFINALVLGTKVLMYSAEVLQQYEDQKEEQKTDAFTGWLEKHWGKEGAWNITLFITMVTSILFTVAVFILLPTVIIGWLKVLDLNEISLNLLEGAFRIVLFVVYLWVISKMEDIKEVFRYHGAEHKTIHCFENGLALTPDHCQPFTTLHPRCGTSFLMFVMIISLVLFSLLGWPNLVLRIVSRVLLVPIIAGLSYELLRWAGNSDSSLVRLLSMPGLWLQKLTTKEPSREQLEIAIASLHAVLEEDESYGEGPCDERGQWIVKETNPELKEEEPDVKN